MRKRWKNRTLIASGYVDEDPMYPSVRGSFGEMRCERESMIDFAMALKHSTEAAA
jgi:hypothetical protein